MTRWALSTLGLMLEVYLLYIHWQYLTHCCTDFALIVRMLLRS